MQYKKKYINDKLLRIGLEEYLEKGYRAANISLIAEKADVPVGNMYRYFDGKSGLLDALVKKTYTELPKIIDQLAKLDAEAGQELGSRELMEHIARLLIGILEEHGKEMILLADKCASTRYEDFSERIIAQVANLVFVKLYPKGNDIDQKFSFIASKAFVNSMFDLLRMDISGDELEAVILRLMNFYFYEIDARM
ncbi:MAG: TetR/AcrR family transcriptional regulator [Firmicutes bacterium]|nr:TetR/AcrR family transcriptional regulator [Bacillota bacterium]